VDDSRVLPKKARSLDGNFVPPYKAMESRAGGAHGLLGGMRRVLRRLVRN
jgi:hypothetical protein